MDFRVRVAVEVSDWKVLKCQFKLKHWNKWKKWSVTFKGDEVQLKSVEIVIGLSELLDQTLNCMS